MMNGIINIYKPSGITSHSVVARIRKFYGVKRVGHSGTLDPMACGVLPVLVGNAASVQELITGHDKIYRAGVLFGKITDTADITGNVLEERKVTFTEDKLKEVISGFIGKQMQVPPMYSAIKQDGVKLYDLARQGIEVERKAREITVYSIEISKPFDGMRCELDISCSKGTYIRTLGEDIGKALGCGACLDSLERLKCGEYTAEKAVRLEDVEKLYVEENTAALEELLTSPEEIFTDLPIVTLVPFYKKLALNGAEIYLKKARISEKFFEKTDMCRLYDENKNFFAVGQLLDYPDGKAIKIKYRFV